MGPKTWTPPEPGPANGAKDRSLEKKNATDNGDGGNPMVEVYGGRWGSLLKKFQKNDGKCWKNRVSLEKKSVKSRLSTTSL